MGGANREAVLRPRFLSTIFAARALRYVPALRSGEARSPAGTFSQFCLIAAPFVI